MKPSVSQLTAEQRGSIWFITQQQKEQYKVMMAKYDGNQSGMLTDREMQQLMMQAKME